MDTSPRHNVEDADRQRAQVPFWRQPGPKLFFAGLVFASFSAFSTRRAVARRRLQAPQLNNLPHPPQPYTNPSIQARQSASDSVLSKGQSSTPSAPQAGQSASAPGYTPAVVESAEAAAQAATHGSAEAANPAAAELNNSPMIMAMEAFTLASMNVFSWGMAAVGGVLWKFDIRSLEEMRKRVRGGGGVDGTGRSEQELEEEIEEWVVNILARKEDKERMKEKLRNERGKDRGL